MVLVFSNAHNDVVGDMEFKKLKIFLRKYFKICTISIRDKKILNPHGA